MRDHVEEATAAYIRVFGADHSMMTHAVHRIIEQVKQAREHDYDVHPYSLQRWLYLMDAWGPECLINNQFLSHVWGLASAVEDLFGEREFLSLAEVLDRDALNFVSVQADALDAAREWCREKLEGVKK